MSASSGEQPTVAAESLPAAEEPDPFDGDPQAWGQEADLLPPYRPDPQRPS